MPPPVAFGKSSLTGKQASMKSFFKKKRKPGRPKKPKKAAPAKAPPAKVYVTPRAKPVRGKATNADWTQGEGLDTLRTLISDWDNKEGAILTSGIHGPVESIGLNKYCQLCEQEWGIKWTTLKAYLHSDLKKRRQPGGRRGRKAVISSNSQSLITQVVRKADRKNDRRRRGGGQQQRRQQEAALKRHQEGVHEGREQDDGERSTRPCV